MGFIATDGLGSIKYLGKHSIENDLHISEIDLSLSNITVVVEYRRYSSVLGPEEHGSIIDMKEGVSKYLKASFMPEFMSQVAVEMPLWVASFN